MELESAELRTPVTSFAETPGPPDSSRLMLRILRVGLILAALAVVTWKQYELDRFFVPKELVLHVTALCAGVLALRSFRRLPFTRVDVLLTIFLLLSALSAFFATNGWLAVRALAVSASGIVIFWAARSLRQYELGWPLLVVLAITVVVVAITSLLQTYGVRTDFFSINRSPGGTLGNRNFVAHMAAFGMPVVLYVALTARRHSAYFIGLLGATLVAGVLVLTRSRAGWLAAGAALGVIVACFVISPALRRYRRALIRFSILVIVAIAGVGAAVTMPNSLRWNTDNPYLESIRGVANFQEGSGRGRLVQYRQSLRMAIGSPLLGVGPGNWAVEYPDYAARRDPSLDNSEPGTTSNPWPSSDWIAYISERGLIATIALAFAMVGIIISALRRLRTSMDGDDALAAAAAIATIAAAAVAGTFDAVLLLALPAMFVWAALGALSDPHDMRAALRFTGERARTAILAIAVLLGAGVGAVHSVMELTGMGIYANAESTRWLARGAAIDPGSYRLHVRLARRSSGLNRASRCEHALAARDLLPNAREARNLASGCD
jgi:O-antigen ligase